MFNKSTTIHLQDKKINLFEYIDKNSNYLKKKYLDIVFRISNLKIYNQTLKKILEYNGYSLWEMSLINEKNIYKNDYVFKTIKYLAIKEILNINLKNEVRINFLERDLIDILKYEYNTTNIIFENYNSSFSENIKKLIKKSSIYNHIYFFYFFLKNCNFQKKKIKNIKKKKFFIFSYFIHYDPKKFYKRIFYPKQWSYLWDIINKNSNFVQLFLPSKKFKFYFQIKNFLSKKKFDNLDEGNFVNNNIFFEFYIKVIKDYNKYKKKINQLDLKNLFKKNKELNFFYLINEELFISSFSGYTLLQNLLWIKVFDILLSDIPKHEYGIFLYENQPWEKALIASWKKYNHGKLIGYSHTTINFWHLNYFNDPRYNLSHEFRRFNPDLIAVSSEISKNFLMSQSVDAKNIVEVEALRYLWLVYKIYTDKKKTKKKILFLGDYKNSINKKLINILNQSTNDLIKLGFDITFKPHPATSVQNIDGKITQTNEDLNSLLDKFEYIISSNTTSAIIEALSCGLRTMLFKDKNNFDLSPLKNTILENKIFSFSTKEELLNEVITSKKSVKSISYYYLNKDIIKWKKILKI